MTQLLTKIDVPADVPAPLKARYEENFQTMTKGTGRLMLFAGDQKVEHLNDDFYGALSDGTPITADDVKRSIERALAPDTPNSFSSFYDRIVGFEPFTTGKTPHLEGVTVGGRLVVSIRLREPDATFLSALAMQALRPVCPSAGDKYDPTWLPCGAGPCGPPPATWELGDMPA